MRTFLKWLLILLAVVLGIALAAVAYLYITTGAQLTKVYDVQPAVVEIPDSPPSELDGFQQLMVSFCADCHGPGLGGQIMGEEDPMLFVISSANLTSGEGGVGGTFTDEDWVRAIRHGVAEDGTPLLIMPSNYFQTLGEEDLQAIVAHIRTLPPIDNVIHEPTVGPIGRFGLLQDPSLIPAAVIDQEAPVPSSPPPGVTLERGEYVAYICTLCHGPDFSGGPTASSGLNLTPAGNLAHWTEADFINTIRTGTTPDGNTFDPLEMPWKQISLLSDEDLKAIWLYLQSLPPVESPYPAPGQGS
jgi:cytochrome c553